jgi:hypothetical protein
MVGDFSASDIEFEDEGENEAMEIDVEAVPPAEAVPLVEAVPPDLALHQKPGLPAGMQQWRGGRQQRQAQRHATMSILYNGVYLRDMVYTNSIGWFSGWITGCVMSKWQQRNTDKSTHKFKLTIEALCAWLHRMRNKDYMVPMCVAISMYCYVNHVSGEVWQLLQFVRLVYNKHWTKTFALEMCYTLRQQTTTLF